MADMKDIDLDITVVIGRARIPLSKLEKAEKDSILELDNEFIEPAIVLVNGKPKFTGEIVTVGNKFGVRIIDEC
ncbi:FliM/FliN family flagellar motor C-terminal domain-containing protein [Leptospira sp. GIMC2001]|uniref:FliM/FliN family flagellar motor C-terminal domain-containing protein n=1 Tax=Leptospira sp. GIMC2001 TaxID=1513297 RepID=UPI00234B9098|nr:FliM/FliN family flagellar motor C-terminal domain-containing protein [Leptospira sp. GIMC2001]WCL50767.1 FliM/FliN family flagellar motor C-terminal domain-containing protein [Leptospira sp. GIMC2001]